jgi:hypothetical protein
MSGRGDNNKNGTSGRGASNQSNQGFNRSEKAGKSSHGDHTGGKRSIPERKTIDESVERNSSGRPAKK